MRSIFHAVAWALFSCLVIGCGGGVKNGNALPETNTATRVETDRLSSSPFKPVRPTETYSDPRKCVVEFLKSVKTGNDAMATSLLTTAAQEEAWKNGLAISADGFPDAEFDVTDVEYLKNDTEAHVKSTWSDVNPAGQAQSFECVWLLQREPHGWCVYGMATKFLEHVPPVVLNFENQREMMQKQQWAAEQIAQHRQQQLRQAEREAPIQQASRPTTRVTK